MSIGKRIYQLRKNKSFSQEYIAEKVGVSRQAVSKWEQDQTAPDTYNLIALAELFNVSVEYLATGKTHNTPDEQMSALTQAKHYSFGTKKIIGFILICTGLLSLILGVLFSETLVMLSAYLLLGGILCLTVRKNFGLVAGWLFFIPSFLFVTIYIVRIADYIFPPYVLGKSLHSVLILALFIWFVLLIITMIIKYVKRNNTKNDLRNS